MTEGDFAFVKLSLTQFIPPSIFAAIPDGSALTHAFFSGAILAHEEKKNKIGSREKKPCRTGISGTPVFRSAMVEEGPDRVQPFTDDPS